MSCHPLIKRLCQSKLQHDVHIPPIRSKLYVNSSKVFQAFHEDTSREPLSAIAKKYSNVIRDQIILVEQFYGAKAIEERAIYQELERLWNLSQIMYFPDPKDKSICLQLMNWYNNSYKPYLLEFDQQEIYFSGSPYKHRDFWPLATRLAMFGQLSQLSSLFGSVLLNKELNDRISKDMDSKDLLKLMKELKDLTGRDVDWLRAHRSDIRKLWTLLYETRKASYTANAMDILLILMGDIKATVNYARDRIHAFISCNYYSESADTNDVHQLAVDFFPTYTKNENISQESQIMIHFLKGNMYEGLQLCSDYDWWLITHLGDLLAQAKMLDRSIDYRTEDGSSISMSARKYFILTFASYLNNQFELWEESFTYLMTCGSIGKEAVIEHLTHMDIQNDDLKLNQIVKFCINYSMKNNGLVLYEKKATICLELKDYKSALQYYNQAEQYQYLDQVFQAVLKDYIYTGKIYDYIQDDSNSNSIHYIIYRDLSKINTLYLQGDFQLSSDLFIQLIQNENIPKNVLVVIFAEGWKLIDRKLYVKLNALMEMKKIWFKLKNNCSLSDFHWYHNYKNNLNPDKTIEGKDISKEMLLQDMTDFLDTSAIIISRSIDNQLNSV